MQDAWSNQPNPNTLEAVRKTVTRTRSQTAREKATTGLRSHCGPWI